EEPARALRALADGDVAQLASGNVRVERLDAAIEPGGRLRGGEKPAGRDRTRLVLPAWEFASRGVGAIGLHRRHELGADFVEPCRRREISEISERCAMEARHHKTRSYLL